jgi:hypothetical protein
MPAFLPAVLLKEVPSVSVFPVSIFVPQTGQKLSPAATSLPQNTQYCLLGSCRKDRLLKAPQFGQNLASASIHSPQFWH